MIMVCGLKKHKEESMADEEWKTTLLCVASRKSAYICGRLRKTDDGIFLLKKSRLCGVKKLASSFSQKNKKKRESWLRDGWLKEYTDYAILTKNVMITSFCEGYQLVVGTSDGHWERKWQPAQTWSGKISFKGLEGEIVIRPWIKLKKLEKQLQLKFNTKLEPIYFILSDDTILPLGAPYSIVTILLRRNEKLIKAEFKLGGLMDYLTTSIEDFRRFLS